MPPLATNAEPTQAVKGSPRVSILAYDGGVMQIPAYGDTVIALDGLEFSESIPLLADHRNNVEAVVGQGRPTVRDGKLYVEGELTLQTPAGAQIIALARENFPFQASVGVQPTEMKRLSRGQSIEVNGQTIKAESRPLTVVTKGHLREVTICALGADPATTVDVAASFCEGSITMKTDDITIQSAASDQPAWWQRALGAKPPEASPDQILALDRQRILAIDQACNVIEPEVSKAGSAPALLGMRQKAISDGLTALDLKPRLEELHQRATELNAERAGRPSPIIAQSSGPAIHSKTGLPASGLAAIEAALTMKAGHSKIAEEHYGAAVLDNGFTAARASVPDLLAMALRMTGQTVPHSRDEMIRAATSNQDVQVALSNVGNLSVLAGYQEAASPIPDICAIRSATDFKDNTSIRGTHGFDLEPVAPSGDIHHGDAGENTYVWSVDTYGKMFSVNRKNLINDSVGIWNEVAPALGRAAKRAENDLFAQVLLGATSAYFDSSLGNDSTDVFDVTALAARITALRTQRHLDNDLDLQPATLYVPPALESDAKAALESEFLQRLVDTDKGPTGNPLRKMLKLKVDSRLSNTAKYGASALATQWYVFGAPENAAIIFAYLNGKQAPTVEFFGLDSDPKTLAVTWRVYHDFGCALGDYMPAQRSTGTGA